MARITERGTKQDWACFIAEIETRYRDAEKITLVMDDLNTHKPGSLYEAFPPEKAKKLWDRFEFVYTPQHGSWLNTAEIELNGLIRQWLAAMAAGNGIDDVLGLPDKGAREFGVHRRDLRTHLVLERLQLADRRKRSTSINRGECGTQSRE